MVMPRPATKNQIGKPAWYSMVKVLVETRANGITLTAAKSWAPNKVIVATKSEASNPIGAGRFRRSRYKVVRPSSGGIIN